MAAAPSYASTPIAWTGLVPSTFDTSFTAPSHVTTLGSAGSSGTKVTQVDVIPVATVVTGLVNLFAYDGTAYHLIESLMIAAATVSTTAPPVKTSLYYDNLVLPTGWSLVVSSTVAGNQSLLEVNAFGASL
jgi:hypothetical protein